MADFITMADKIIASLSYIKTVSKKKATIEKILAHLSKSEICDKTWSNESLQVLLSGMTAKNQIVLVDSAYKRKQNEAQDDNDNEAKDDNHENCNFVKNTQIDCISSVSDNLVANLETVITPETQQTPLLPSDLLVTRRRPIKSVYNDNTQSFISLQNMFLKEIETIKNFTKSIENKFEKIEYFITSLLVNSYSVGTPEKGKESERKYLLVVELLKRRVSTLEKQLAEKDAIIRFILNQKVIDNTAHLSARFLITIFSVTKNQRIPILKIRIMKKNRRKRKLL